MCENISHDVLHQAMTTIMFSGRTHINFLDFCGTHPRMDATNVALTQWSAKLDATTVALTQWSATLSRENTSAKNRKKNLLSTTLKSVVTYIVSKTKRSKIKKIVNVCLMEWNDL